MYSPSKYKPDFQLNFLQFIIILGGSNNEFFIKFLQIIIIHDLCFSVDHFISCYK